jgi:peroxiredoxin
MFKISASNVIGTLANIAVIGVCGFWLVQVGMNKTQASKTTTPMVSHYGAGTTLPDNTLAEINKAPLTLLLVTKSQCPWCSASLPFYRKLAPLARRAGTRLVGVTPEAVPDNRKYLEGNGISIDNVLSLDETHIKADATPSLILARAGGIVVKEWVGKLDEQREEEVLKAVLRRY